MELLDDNYGNQRLDKKIITQMRGLANVTVAYPKGWFAGLPSGIKTIQYRMPKQGKNQRRNYYKNCFIHLWLAWKLDRKEHYDILFFSSYHTGYTFLMPIIFKKSRDRVLIMHHNNIDKLDQSGKKRAIFSLYAKKVKHIVLEDFIGKHLHDTYGIAFNQIYCMEHPLNGMAADTDYEIDGVGISNSNDEGWIKSVIEQEKKTKILKKKNVKIVLRSASQSFDDGYLKVFSGKLSDQEYDQYITGGKVVLIPFPDSYKYRMSGSVVDAFSNGKSVVGSHIPLIHYYAKKYPHICRVETDFNRIADYLSKYEGMNKEGESERKEYWQRHSDQRLNMVIRQMLDDGCQKRI